MPAEEEDEQQRLRSAALQDAGGILAARQRAEHELLRAREALQARERELSLIYDNVSDVIFYLEAEPGGDYRFVSVNKGFLAATGLSHQDVVGRSVREVIPEPSLSLVLKNYETACREGRTVRWEETTEYPAGRKVGEVSVTPIFDAGRCTHLIGTVHDVTERKRAEEFRARLAAVVESSDDAIVSKTLDGVIMTWNQGAERMFGYTAEEAVGRPILMLLPPDRLDEEPRILERLRRGERIEHYETVRRRKNGTLFDVSLTVSPVKDGEGRIVGASKIARDITERKLADAERERLLEAERAARGEAERVGLLKDEFLATLSHELRTPLNAILGWSQILRTEAVDEEMKEGLDVIERNTRVQAQLIDDLLDMSRIVSGKLRLDVQRVEMQDVVRAAIASVRQSAEAKEIRLQAVLDPLAGPVRGDPNRLQQVMWNLLSNAIKFTPKGGRVQVTLGRVNSHLEVTVSDTGAGIKPEFLPHVFERFRQADASTTRNHGGLGLGLSIVKSLVELHGGTVRASSPGEGRGATFSVELPVVVAHGPEPSAPREHPGAAPAAPAGPIDHPSLAGVTVLAVDDEADARTLLRRLLEDCGARVLLAASAKEGLAVVRRERPDMIVSDIGMPGEDGYAFIRQVRQLPPEEGGRTPAAALTAFARSEDRTRALRAGYQTHVAKPVEPAELTAVVASLATRR